MINTQSGKDSAETEKQHRNPGGQVRFVRFYVRLDVPNRLIMAWWDRMLPEHHSRAVATTQQHSGVSLQTTGEILRCIEPLMGYGYAPAMSDVVAELVRSAGRLANAGRLEEAEQAWQEVHRLQPRHPKALFSLGIHALTRQDFPAALNLLRAAEAPRRQTSGAHGALGRLSAADRRRGRTRSDRSRARGRSVFPSGVARKGRLA